MQAEASAICEVLSVTEPVLIAQQLPDLLTLQPDFLTPADSRFFFDHLLHQHPWPAQHYEVYGRRFTLPRQQTWHADPGIVYSWSDNLLQTRPWTPVLQVLREKVQQATGEAFNAVLVNLYRNGQHYVDWHTDDDKEMGERAVIASLSLGASRAFSLRKAGKSDHQSLMLSSGSLLVMQAGFQQMYEHALLPDDTTSHKTEPRINLTFRYVYPKMLATSG